LRKLIFQFAVIVIGLASYFLWAAEEEAAIDSQAIYVCPMHPEETSTEEGRCSICGMYLVRSDKIERTGDIGGGRTHPEHTHDDPGVPEEHTGESDEILYTCPMHPTYITERPGDCPICGMTLVKVGEEETAENMPEGSFEISSGKQQLLGIETTQVQFRDHTWTIKAVGVVDYDETRVVSVTPRVHGWAETVHADYTGKHVRKGEPLIEIYSPELVSTQQEYLLAVKNRDSLSGTAVQSSAESLVETTRKRLLLWGITEGQIENIEAEGSPRETMYLSSPMSGYVIEKNVDEGEHLKPGDELYIIADLSTVWVYADLYEYELAAVYNGQLVEVHPHGTPERYRGVVDHIYPFLDHSTRTARIRIALRNTGLNLKPAMYVDVRIKVDRGLKLAVPSEAVLDTGTRKLVFVKTGEGYFEPREITTGMKSRDFYEVAGGVGVGEEVVTSANFFVDSESKLKAALARAMEHRH
jgi:multidrug efflux pump subunit AcrA (membrane-fusion protein)